MRMRNK